MEGVICTDETENFSFKYMKCKYSIYTMYIIYYTLYICMYTVLFTKDNSQPILSIKLLEFDLANIEGFNEAFVYILFSFFYFT